MDRNFYCLGFIQSSAVSLSARRAWIEMFDFPVVPAELTTVALRKESVDRNNDTSTHAKINLTSLSARRAWIEITDRRH